MKTTTAQYHLKAILVAIDMLALALLMNAGSFVDKTSDKIFFIGVVFITVSVLCFVAARYMTSVFDRLDDERPSLILILRIIESFLIFYFVMELIGVIAYGSGVLSSPYIVSAGLLTFSILQYRGYKRAYEAAEKAVETLGTVNPQVRGIG